MRKNFTRAQRKLSSLKDPQTLDGVNGSTDSDYSRNNGCRIKKYETPKLTLGINYEKHSKNTLER